MEPLIVPILMVALVMTPYVLVRTYAAIKSREVDSRAAAAVGLALLFILTGIGHFAKAEPMSQMLPGWVPMRVPIIYLTGVMEFALALGFIIPRTRRWAGWAAAALLVLFFPANIYAAVHRLPFGGEWGPAYLLIRTPLQAFLLFWAYWFCVRAPARAPIEESPHGN